MPRAKRLKVASYVEAVYRTWCPKCKVVNYVNNGNLEDVTVEDVGGIECYKCGTKYLLYDPGIDDDMESTRFEKGWPCLE